jgi:hypothetical protein
MTKKFIGGLQGMASRRNQTNQKKGNFSRIKRKNTKKVKGKK